MNWDDLQYGAMKIINLYMGDIPKERPQYKTHVGLSLTRQDHNHIKHDITQPFNITDNSVHSIQSEDVLEHVEYSKLPDIINEVYRVLIPNGLFRLSVPDYGCDILYERSLKDNNGNILFDPGGGGFLDEKSMKVINGGHLWFPKYENVLRIIAKTKFFTNGRYDFLHYYHGENYEIKNIDYSLGYISRTPDHDHRVQDPRRPMSLVVDLYKGDAS